MFTLTGSVFKDISVTGDLLNGNDCHLIRCNAKAGGLLNIGNSKFSDCLLGGINTIQDGADTAFDQCFSDKDAVLTIDFNDPTQVTVANFSDFKGDVIFINMNNNAYVNITGDCLATIDATCINAKIKLAGDVKLVDSGGTTTVTDNRISDADGIIDAINASETNILNAIDEIPEDILAEILDGAATVGEGLKRILSYCNGNIVRIGANYKYTDFDKLIDLFEFDVVVTPGGHTRIRTDLP